MWNKILGTLSLVVVGIALGTGAEIGKNLGKATVDGCKKEFGKAQEKFDAWHNDKESDEKIAEEVTVEA